MFLYPKRLLAVSAFLSSSYATRCGHADTVFRNGSIHTLDADNTVVQSMAIKDGTIAWLGKDDDAALQAQIGPNTTVVSLDGRMAMPGLVDAHMHVISGGLMLLKCNLNYQPLDLAQVLAHVQGCIDSEPTKTGPEWWLEVVNMDYATLSTRSGVVNKLNLDKGLNTARPVFIRSSDFHTVIANSAALTASNITAATPDPPGGKVERLPGSLEPSGILQDDARDLLTGPPPPSAQDNVIALKAALKLLREAGITSFQDASAAPSMADVFGAVKAAGELTARAWFDYRIDAPTSEASIPTMVADIVNHTSRLNDPAPLGPKATMKWHAIKGFLDGVIVYPASTGALMEPYWRPVDANGTVWLPDNSTMRAPYWDPKLLSLLLEQLILNGIDAQFHGDGDMAVHIVLEAVQQFREKHPDFDNYRVGIAHDELTHPDDWPRFAELAVDAIMSFQWAQPSSFWIPDTFNSLGPARLNFLEAYGSIESAGRPVTYGSDWPIDPLDCWLALKAGVTRSGDPNNPNSPASQGPQFQGTLPGEGLSRLAALRAYTINAAKFLRAHDKIGSLEKGKLADVIVLRRNWFEVAEEELGRNQVLLTMLGGEVIYTANGTNFGKVGPRFAGDDAMRAMLDKRTVGGFGGRELSEYGKSRVSKLHRRAHQCHHS